MCLHKRLIEMTRHRITISRLLTAAILSLALGGYYPFNDDRFADWLEYRVKRADDQYGFLVAKVNRRTDKVQWLGDSYKVLVRWPSNVELLPIAINETDRKKEAQAFLLRLCGGNQEIRVTEESFNDRTSEINFFIVVPAGEARLNFFAPILI